MGILSFMALLIGKTNFNRINIIPFWKTSFTSNMGVPTCVALVSSTPLLIVSNEARSVGPYALLITTTHHYGKTTHLSPKLIVCLPPLQNVQGI